MELSVKNQTTIIANLLPTSILCFQSGPLSTGTQSRSVVAYQENTWDEIERIIPNSRKVAASMLIRSDKRNTKTSSDTASTSRIPVICSREMMDARGRW